VPAFCAHASQRGQLFVDSTTSAAAAQVNSRRSRREAAARWRALPPARLARSRQEESVHTRENDLPLLFRRKRGKQKVSRTA